MKAFIVNADMRTPDNIDFGLDYFVFVDRKAIEQQYEYTFKSGESIDSPDMINDSKKTIVLSTEDWEAAVTAHFDQTVRSVNPNVDGIKITEITL